MPMTSHSEFFATAPKYTEGLLLDEIKSLGADEARETVGGVSFSGSLELAYRVCLWSRIANRVLLNLHQCKIRNADDLYNSTYAINWNEHFTSQQTFCIDFTSTGSIITHSQFGAQKCKDAIVDQFRHNTGNRPDVEKTDPSIRINVHVKQQDATISIDLSGHSLHQRGYRKHTVEAPLKENLAAAVLMRSGWVSQNNITAPLIDPMCGSGTILIEAALIASNTAPGLLREDFGFKQWLAHDEVLWQSLRKDALNARKPIKIPLIGYDIDAHAITSAISNSEIAGMAENIQFKCQPLAALTNETQSNKGFLVTNAPYGERLSENEALGSLYEKLGQILRQSFSGWSASIVTSDPSLASATRLRAKRKNKLYNGNLLCTIYHYDIAVSPEAPGSEEKQSNKPAIDEGLTNRLTKNLRHLKKWAAKNNIDCYRVYDADLPEFNFALDLYHSDRTYAVFQEYAAPASIDTNIVQRRSRIARNTVLQVLNIDRDRLFYKERKKQSGKNQYEKLQSRQHQHIVKENNCSFYVNFEDYLDTGLFLDHRLTRELIQQEAKGKKFLNLFSYTGTASVHAAIGGASSTTSVDMSSTYLTWCRENFELNKIPLNLHSFIRANCMDWLKDERTKYDLIFVDPPTFSNSKNMEGIFDIQRDYVALLKNCVRLLSPGGKIIFSTNFRKFRLNRDELPELDIIDITARTIPDDYARHKNIHYCWLMTTSATHR